MSQFDIKSQNHNSMKPTKRRQVTTTRAVKAMERKLGVKLTPVEGGFHLAVLPKDHPMAKEAGNNRLLFKIIDADVAE